MQFDLSLDELRLYRPKVRRPADFDAFWADQMEAASGLSREPEVSPV
jgi:cephalosporin-C deacetylase